MLVDLVWEREGREKIYLLKDNADIQREFIQILSVDLHQNHENDEKIGKIYHKLTEGFFFVFLRPKTENSDCSGSVSIRLFHGSEPVSAGDVEEPPNWIPASCWASEGSEAFSITFCLRKHKFNSCVEQNNVGQSRHEG